MAKQSPIDPKQIVLCSDNRDPITVCDPPLEGRKHSVCIDGVTWHHVAEDTYGRWLYTR